MLSRAGVDPPHPPPEPADLDAIDAVIAPMSLPRDVRRWWECVDPHSVRAWAYPDLIAPSFALDTWKQHRDEFPGIAPRALFLVGYASWACISVELDSPLGPGGSLFEWRLEDGGFYLRYHALPDWLGRIAELVEEGRFERRDGATGPRLLLDDPHTSLPMVSLPAPATPSPVHGDVTSYERHPLENGRSIGSGSRGSTQRTARRPRGATHPIAEVLESDPSKSFQATVAGRVVSLGSYGELTGVKISDGTDEMSIRCPHAVTALGPVMGQHFEFDVTLPSGLRRTPHNVPSLATATAIRPVVEGRESS